MPAKSRPSIVCPACSAQASGNFCAECGASLSTRACRQCGFTLAAGDSFCSECGASAADRSSRRRPQSDPTPSKSGRSPATFAPWGIGAVVLIAVAVYLGGKGSDASGSAAASDAPAAPFAPFANGGGNPPDLSSIPPRERASRLYDRIMRYAEQGQRDSLLFFAPMAMASFEMLGTDLDLDARYDYGRVASEAGQLDIAAAQADTILKSAPTHLLGLALKARTAATRGDAATAKKTWAAFVDAKDAELRKNLAEYQMHAEDIKRSAAMAERGN